MEVKELTIDPEFSALGRRLTCEEDNYLYASLCADGCRDAIVTWANHDDIILDGHNRYRLCREHDIPFKVKAISLPDRESCIDWIAKTALGRRNLTDEEKSYLRGKRHESVKKEIGAPSGNKNARKQKVQNEPIESTAKQLAAEFNVSPSTIKRDSQYAKAVDTIAENVGVDVKSTILSGESRLTKSKVEEIASLPAKRQAKAIAEAKDEPRGKSSNGKSGHGGTVVKTDCDKLIERIEQFIANVDRMAVSHLGHNDQSRAVVRAFRDCISKVKAMHRSWRTK